MPTVEEDEPEPDPQTFWCVVERFESHFVDCRGNETMNEVREHLLGKFATRDEAVGFANNFPSVSAKALATSINRARKET